MVIRAAQKEDEQKHHLAPVLLSRLSSTSFFQPLRKGFSVLHDRSPLKPQEEDSKYFPTQTLRWRALTAPLDFFIFYFLFCIGGSNG